MTHTQESPQSLRPSPGQTHLSNTSWRVAIGDRVITPTGRQGAIIQPEFTLHLHYLILFDDGAVLWMLKEILQPMIAKPAAKRLSESNLCSFFCIYSVIDFHVKI